MARKDDNPPHRAWDAMTRLLAALHALDVAGLAATCAHARRAARLWALSRGF